MNHNKHNLKIGQEVWLDSKYRNKSKVIIHSFTPNQMFAFVLTDKTLGDMWQVMTNRLTPIDNETNIIS
jgi:hypothetical protein